MATKVHVLTEHHYYSDRVTQCTYAIYSSRAKLNEGLEKLKVATAAEGWTHQTVVKLGFRGAETQFFDPNGKLEVGYSSSEYVLNRDNL